MGDPYGKSLGFFSGGFLGSYNAGLEVIGS